MADTRRAPATAQISRSSLSHRVSAASHRLFPTMSRRIVTFTVALLVLALDVLAQR